MLGGPLVLRGLRAVLPASRDDALLTTRSVAVSPVRATISPPTVSLLSITRPEVVHEVVAGGVSRNPKGAHPTASLPAVGGRLSRFAPNWERLHPDSWVLSVISRGYKIEFTANPPLMDKRRVTPIPQDPGQRKVLEEEILGLLRKRAIYIARPNPGPLYRSTFFLAPKKPDKWRPILNLKPLNKLYVRPARFRMETLKQIIPALRQGMWATSVDLRDAYLHIPIHEEFHKFLAFRYRGTDFCFRALPFGLSTAPRVFTRVTRSILAVLRSRGLQVYAYLDDWLVVADSEEACHHATYQVLSLLRQLGWIVNQEKSALSPAQKVVYLGAVLDFTTGRASPSPQRIQTLTTQVSDSLGKPRLRAREWLQLLGQMASLVDVLPFCRLFMRPIQVHLLAFFKPSRHPLSRRVPVSRQVRHNLLWWSDPSNLNQGVPFQQFCVFSSITTDASLTGWGAVWNSQTLAGRWPETDRTLHINILELQAIIQAVQHWAPRLRGHQVTVFSDNTTAVSYINHQGGTKSTTLCSRTWDLLHMCRRWDILLRASHLAGSDNSMADALSRGRLLGNEWALDQSWANLIFIRYDRPQVDLFATKDNAKLPTFVTRHFHPEAWAVDALSIPWNGLYAYAFPPFCLINKVLLRLKHSDTDLLLVAPHWPNQPWYPVLLSMLVDLPFKFPPSRRLLLQGRGRIWHDDPSLLHLSVWKLSSNPSKRQAFLQTLRRLPRTHAARRPSPHITLAWTDIASGRRTTASIPWAQL